MQATIIGALDAQKFADTFARLLAKRDGMEVVPGSVRYYRIGEGQAE